MPFIDVHVHSFREDKEKGFLERLIEAGEKYDGYFCLMSGGPRYDYMTNEEVLAARRRCPKRIIPFSWITLGLDEAKCVKELHARGFKGLKLINPLVDYDDDKAMPFYEYAEELGMVCLFHTGTVATNKTDAQYDVSSNRMRPICLDRIKRRFPGLTIVGAHLGFPWFTEAICVANGINSFMDICGIQGFIYGPKRWVELPKLFYAGPESYRKLVFGTEGHPANYGEYIDFYNKVLDEGGAGDDVRKDVFFRTLAKPLGIAAGTNV